MPVVEQENVQQDRRRSCRRVRTKNDFSCTGCEDEEEDQQLPTLLVAFLFAILIAVFALQNTMTVNVRFLVWEYETSLVLIILDSAMLGAILTLVASVGPRIRRA